MAQLVAKRYADALFELANEKGAIDDYLNSLLNLKEFLNDEDLIVVLKHPEVSGEDKFGILKNCLDNKDNTDITGLLNLLAIKGRAGLLAEIIDEFKAVADEYKNLLVAHVYSAKKLSEGQVDRVNSLLQKKYNKQFSIIEHIDPSVIGGLKVRVGDDMVDTSIKKDIEEIRNALLK